MGSKRAFIFAAIAFASFYVIMLCAIGYATVFLRAAGASKAGSGTIVAIACIVAAVLQTVLGRVCDRLKNVDWKRLSLVLSVLLLIVFLGVFFAENTLLIVLFFIAIILAYCINPFLNECSFYYERNGIHVNFGIVRGVGSLFYALISYLFRFADLEENTGAIVSTGIVATVILIVSIIVLPRVKGAVSSTHKEKKSEIKEIATFFKRYKVFMLFWFALIFIMTFQNLFSANLIDIVEKAGGDVSTMGVALSLAAVVELPVMFLFSRIMKKLSPERLLLIGAFFYIVRCVLFLVANSMALIYVAQAFQMLTYAVVTPASVYLSDKLIDKEFSNTGQALVAFTVTVGTVFGFFIGGLTAERGGATRVLIAGLIITIVGFILMLIANIISKRSKNVSG